MPALTVHNAEVKTAAVEIKMLTISGKQVTLAVFRQLKEEPLIAEGGTLNGVPWGTVNYHPDKCGDSRAHLHVVWQLGTELRRSRVDQPRWWLEKFPAEAADEYMQAAYCRNDHNLSKWVERDRIYDGFKGFDVFAFNLDGVNCVTLDRKLENPRYSYVDGARRRADDDPHCCPSDGEFAEIQGYLRQEVGHERDRRARIDAHWAALNEIPHLFIAV